MGDLAYFPIICAKSCLGYPFSLLELSEMPGMMERSMIPFSLLF